MKRIWLIGLAIIAIAIEGKAEIGETKPEAIARWGKPGREIGNTAWWEVGNRYVKEIFDKTGHAVMCWYFSDSVIDQESGQAMALLVFPKDTGWKETAVPTNSESKDAGISHIFLSDGGNSIVIGVLTQGKNGKPLPPIYFIYYCTPRGMVMIERGEVHLVD
jgi:hypothetical protein